MGKAKPQNGLSDPTLTEPSNPTTEEPAKPWNVMVYMAADNNLKVESIYALSEILEANKKLSSQLEVTVQFDSGEAVTVFEFNKDAIGRVTNTVKQKKVKAMARLASANKLAPTAISAAMSSDKVMARAASGDDDFSEIRLEDVANPLITNLSVVEPLSDSKMLEGFLKERLKREKNNMIVLSGHGSGAVGDFLTTNNPPSALSIMDIRAVLARVRRPIDRKVDVLGMDSCLMSMAEVCYELREDVDYLVGSEGFSLNTGWPYRHIFSRLEKQATIDPEQCARMIVREYIHYYAPYTMAGVSVDQTACALAGMEELKNLLLKLADTLIGALKEESTLNNLADRKLENAILLAHWRAQSYKFEQYVDLSDFCSLLAEHYSDKNTPNNPDISNIPTLCQAIVAQVKNVAALSCYSGAAFQYSKGLSIYFPWSKADLDRNLLFYQELSFSRDTHWGDFLTLYGEQTQRAHNQDKTNKFAFEEPPEIPMSVEIEVGSAVLDGVRASRPEGTKASRPEGTKGGRFPLPMMKNPSDKFLKYDDDCFEEKSGDAARTITPAVKK